MELVGIVCDKAPCYKNASPLSNKYKMALGEHALEKASSEYLVAWIYEHNHRHFGVFYTVCR